MKDLDLRYLCTGMGSLCGFPVRLYEGENMVLLVDHAGLRYDPIQACRRELFALPGHVGTYITPRFFFYGVIRTGDTRVILGPTRQLSATDQQLREVAFLSGVPGEDTADFLQAMRSLSPMPLESLQQILCTMNYVMNGEKLNLESIALNGPSEKPGTPSMEGKSIEASSNENPLDGIHNTLAVEQTLMNMIRKGDTEGLRRWIAEAPAVHAGPMAHEHLRQYRNTFIVTATLAARSAIRGGMDVEEALSTSDLLIRNCEALQDVQSILRLQADMLLNYAGKVQRLRTGSICTPLALQAAAWVQKHLSEPVDTEKMAQAFHFSRPHLSRRFRQETGMTLIDFILTQKCEEAARLLAYTDKSMTAISEYLGFSSQSHFARVFRKYMGTSPSEYRKEPDRAW
ncbi:MAG: helix-turn-helix transcriptional regulator [Clostridia bacterium]|nr:helix-turn-helix transcriptional regulator [Clostridia bacterium]